MAVKTEIKYIQSVMPDWQKWTFDALLFPMEELNLSAEDEKKYAHLAVKAVRHICWTPYDEARAAFMCAANELLGNYVESIEEKARIRKRMYVRFMEGRIEYYIYMEKVECCPETPVAVGRMDFHNTEMASVFAHLPEQPEIEKWLQELDVRWTYDQLHMVTWFSCQLSLGSGKYSRSRPNHSAKVTYERLVNPYSLLWIAAALGVDKDLIVKTRKEINGYKSWRAKCGAVRRAIPWERIYELALPLVEDERKRG